MTAISMRFPADVIEDLKRVAPLRGFTGYQPLIRAYVGQGLRVDLEQIDTDPVTALVESLIRHGVSESIIQEALTEAARRYRQFSEAATAIGYACPNPRTQRRPSMNDSTKVGAAALAEFVRATQDAEFDDGDAARVSNLLANTKATLAALADRPRFDAEPAEMATVMRRLAPTATAAASGAGAGAEEGAS